MADVSWTSSEEEEGTAAHPERAIAPRPGRWPTSRDLQAAKALHRWLILYSRRVALHIRTRLGLLRVIFQEDVTSEQLAASRRNDENIDETEIGRRDDARKPCDQIRFFVCRRQETHPRRASGHSE